MGKNVIISVKGTQTDLASDVSGTELITEGKYYKKGNSYYVTYKETEITGMEGTTTTLKFSDGKITLMRFGTTNSHLIFEQGKRHVSYYETQYGAFTIGVYTHQMVVKMDDDGGEISVNYQIEVDNSKAGDNDFHMLIREAGHTNDRYGGICEEADQEGSCGCIL